MLAILKSSYLVKEQVAKYIIHGEKGSFIKSGSDPQETRLKKGWKADNSRIGIEPESEWGRLFTGQTAPGGEIVPSEKGNYLEFYNGVYWDLMGSEGSAVSAEEGLDVIRIIEAAQESNRSGKKIIVFS